MEGRGREAVKEWPAKRSRIRQIKWETLGSFSPALSTLSLKTGTSTPSLMALCGGIGRSEPACCSLSGVPGPQVQNPRPHSASSL